MVFVLLIYRNSETRFVKFKVSGLEAVKLRRKHFYLNRTHITNRQRNCYEWRLLLAAVAVEQYTSHHEPFKLADFMSFIASPIFHSHTMKCVGRYWNEQDTLRAGNSLRSAVAGKREALKVRSLH